MKAEGNIVKMKSALGPFDVQYELPIGEQLIGMNQFIGKEIRLTFDGQINCIDCGRKTKKSFAQGFCYLCFQSSPMNAECIIRPELCEAHLGKGRDVEWEKKYHLRPHYVYLALASGIKVGITSEGQLPTRWIDQGARKAIVIAETPNRYLCGMIEMTLKAHVSDKTNWQKMLKNAIDHDYNLIEEKERMLALLDDELKQYASLSNEVIDIQFPVPTYPSKIKSMSFDKQPIIDGRLVGIRGQYLIFDEGRVLNLRKHTGYYLKLEEIKNNLLF